MAEVKHTPETLDPYKAANLDEAPLEEKIKDLITFVEKCKFCMMTTHDASSGILVSRCMALAGKERDDLDLIFHSNAHSGKAADLAAHADVNLGFLTSSGEWASISGPARVVHDQEEVRQRYSPLLKAWLGDLKDGKHDGGPDDPRICLIKVRAVAAQYAVSRKGLIGTAIELAKGVKEGEVPSVNKLRTLSNEEIEKWRARSKEASRASK